MQVLQDSSVATLQGQAGSWYLCRQKNVHGAVGMSGMPFFTGRRAMCVCVSHVMAPAPQHGTHHGTCPLACLPSSLPPAGSPTCLSTRGKQSRKTAGTLHNIT